MTRATISQTPPLRRKVLRKMRQRSQAMARYWALDWAADQFEESVGIVFEKQRQVQKI